MFYGTPSDLNHTGVVIGFDATYITTIEGNTNDDGGREGDGVYRKVRRRRDSNVVGYGHPKFPAALPPEPVPITRRSPRLGRCSASALAKAKTAERREAIRKALRRIKGLR